MINSVWLYCPLEMVHQQNNTSFNNSIFQSVELYPFVCLPFLSQFVFTIQCHLSVFVISVLNHTQIIVIIVYRQ
jgi:hypothetical protein